MVDLLTRFSFADYPIRGGIVQLSGCWQEIRALQEEGSPLERLGEAMTAAPLLGSNIKFDGRLSIQLTGGKDISMLLADASADGTLRGLAQGHGAGDDLNAAASGGSLSIAIEPASGQRFQGLVALEGNTLAACLEHYFLQSEQLPTRIWLYADDTFAGGMMLQRMPGELDDDDAWARLTTLAATLHFAELERHGANEVLHRLFHRERVKLHGEMPLRFGCHCTAERVEAMLRSLGEEELSNHPEDSITVRCGFCNRAYVYDPVDLLAALRSAGGANLTRQ